MADHHHQHHRHHRPNRISLPPRAANPTSRPSYTHLPYPPTTPTPTPSKHRLSLSKPSSATATSSFSFLLLLLFSLRSLYSLLPFLRSSPPSFSIFPFSFLVSLLSFVLSLAFSVFASVFAKGSSYYRKKPIFSLTLISQSQHKFLLAKSLLLATVFLLRFQALNYCGAAAMILAELSGNVAARFIGQGKIGRNLIGSSKVRGFIAMFTGLILFSISWDRIECFPLSQINITRKGFLLLPNANCFRIWPMLLPFLSGFLGYYERNLGIWGEIRELGQKRIRLITLFLTTVVLLIPAGISMLVFEVEGDSISISSLGWPLANTVVFGVLLSEACNDEKDSASKEIQKEYVVTFVCTLVLELFYFPELSLWGLLICGMLLWVSVRELNPIYVSYPELGFESSEPLSSSIMKPIRHILSERKSRKIALFLLINTAYMVIEFVAGFMSNSLGLISDACHMLFDCAALAIGLYASYISRLPVSSQFNYGRGRFEVLSGYVNAVFLVLVGALITLESIERILDPQEISTSSLLAVSIGGLGVNVVGLIFFHEEHHHAHGGSGSCSHSHSHSHDDRHHSHSHSHSDSHDDHQHSHSHSHSHIDHHHSHSHSSGHSHDSHQVVCHHVHEHDGKLDHKHPEHTAVCSDEVHCAVDHGNHKTENLYTIGGKVEHETKCCSNHDHHHQPVDPLNHDHLHVNLHYQHQHSLDHHNHANHLLEKRVDKSHHHHHIDHNMQGIFLHVLADTLGSVGVVISTLLIKYKGWLISDPACSIFISALIVSSVIPLLRNSAEILLQRIPRSCDHDLKEVLNDIMKLKGVFGIQNLHVWSFTNTDIVGTIHLQVLPETDKGSMRKQVWQILHEAGIKDLIVQVECVNLT